MDRERIRANYENLTDEQIVKEKSRRQAAKEDALKRHEDEANKMTSGIVMSAIGLFFIWLLPASIPLLVIGIPQIVKSAKARHEINSEYEDAVARLKILQEIAEERHIQDQPEEVTGEVI